MQTCDCSCVENYALEGVGGEVTHIGGDTANDDLFLASGRDGSAEVSVVPSIDFTIPADDGDVGVHLGDLGKEWAIGALNEETSY